MDTIKDLLTIHYPKEKGSKITPVYPARVEESTFVLSDPHSCNNCEKQSHGFVECDKNVMIVESSSPVVILNFDSFMNSFSNSPAQINGRRCDYLLYDTGANKSCIAFCELTCSDAQYVEQRSDRNRIGKRAIAFNQIYNSLEHLLHTSILDQEILTYPHKFGIFGWREQSPSEANDSAIRSMSDFSITPSSDQSSLSSTEYILGHGFTFVQIKHPCPFIWV